MVTSVKYCGHSGSCYGEEATVWCGVNTSRQSTVLVTRLGEVTDQIGNKLTSIFFFAATAPRLELLCIHDVNKLLRLGVFNTDSMAIAVNESTDIRDIARCYMLH